MMKNATYFFLFSLLLFGSCIRDEIQPCPPLQVQIVVKDKNYFNADKVGMEERRSEELPFREYVPTLYYTLRDASTGKVMEKADVFRVPDDGATFIVTFNPDLPFGTYIITVWGGLKDDTPTNDDPAFMILHAEQAEGEDIYLTSDTLLYDARNNDYTVALERTKGKLIIQATGLPAGVDFSDKDIGGLFQNVDNAFNYSGTTSVHTQTGWSETSGIVTRTLLAPSQKENGSRVEVHLYGSQTRAMSVLTPQTVNITMERNKLTALRYVYDDSTGGFTIYILLDDAWSVIYEMEID